MALSMLHTYTRLHGVPHATSPPGPGATRATRAGKAGKGGGMAACRRLMPKAAKAGLID